MSTNKLFRNIENNAFDYKHLTIKKINCQFDNGKIKTSFKASIQADKDKQITIVLSKLNIPVGRLRLTRDSVKFVNNLEKKYFIDDYSHLSSVLNMDLDFETVQAIISSNIFSLGIQKREKEIKDYEVKIDSGMYVLESVKELKLPKEIQKMSERKQARKVQKIIPDSPVRQSIYIDPVTYKLRKIELVDATNARNLSIDFSDFVPVGKQLHPGEMSLNLASPEKIIQLHIKFAGFSTETEKDVRFKIPEKYTRINR